MNRSNRNQGAGHPTLERLSWKDILTAILLSVLSLSLYTFTAAPSVTLEDSGDFINGVLTLGIVHQPGYPLYTVLGHLFSYLPIGDPAFRVNLFSALWGALCLGVLFLSLRILAISPLHSVFTSISLGLTTVFWSKTGIAEVYSLNVFLLACVVFCILSYNRDKRKGQFYLAALTTGLALANHYPLVILSGVGLIFLLERKDLHLTDYVKGLLFLSLGLTPYLYLFIQAFNPDLQYNFAKVSSPAMVLDHILRKVDHNEYGGTFYDKIVFSLWFSKMFFRDFLISSFFILCGIVVSVRQKWKYRYAFLLAFLGPSLGLILLITIPATEGNRSLLVDISVPAYFFLSIFLALGLGAPTSRYIKNHLIHIVLLVILLLCQAGANFGSSSRHNNELVHIWGTELLNSLKPDSILILCASGNHALNYLHLARGLRPDVTLYDRFSAYTAENLYAPELLFRMRNQPQEFRRKREQKLIKTSSAPIYYTCKEPIDEMGLPFSTTPYIYRVDKNHSEAADFTQFSVSERFLNALVDSYPKSDARLTQLKSLIWSRLVTYYGGHKRPEVHRILDSLQSTEFHSQTPFILSLANNLYYFHNYDLARTFYELAEKLSPGAFDPTDLAVYCNLLTNARNYGKALVICMRQEQSAAPCEQNTINTRQTVAAIYKDQKDWPKVAKYSRRILECQPDHPVAQSYLDWAMQGIENRSPATELIANDEPKKEK